MIIDEAIVMFGMEDPVAGRSELTIVVVEHPALAGSSRSPSRPSGREGMTIDELSRLRRPTAPPRV